MDAGCRRPQAFPVHRERARHQQIPRRRHAHTRRRRPGLHARHRFRHISLRHLIKYHDCRSLHRPRRSPQPCRKGDRYLQSLLHARRKRPVPDRTLRRDRREPAADRPRVRRHHGPPAPLRLAGPRGAQVRRDDERRKRTHHDEGRRPQHLQDHQGGDRLRDRRQAGGLLPLRERRGSHPRIQGVPRLGKRHL